MDMSLPSAAYGDSRDSIQLEASYNALHHDTGKGGTGPSLQEKLNKAIRYQICCDQKRLGEDLITKDLFHQSLEALGNQSRPI